MPKMRELEGISLLRRLVNMPAENRPGEPFDPGWCCNEHASIASLAFCCLGVRAELAKGKAAFADRDAKSVKICSPHWFVLLGTEEQPTGLFDSSASLGPMNGFPVLYKGCYPRLAVSLNVPLPSGEQIWAVVKNNPGGFVAIYEPQLSAVPGRAAVKHISFTPFGKWLNAAVGSQDGIWGKAALVVAQTIMAGEPENPPGGFSELSKLDLWHWIAAAPNVDDLVLRQAAALA